LLRRQKGKLPDLSQVSVQSSIGFIHEQNIFPGPTPPLLRIWGIFPCRYRGDGRSLFRDINGPTPDDGRSCQSRFAGKIMFG
jgi:hypothetical protein